MQGGLEAMIWKFKGPCVDTMRDKKGTLFLIIEESTEGKPVLQKVRCWSKDVAAIANEVRIGDVVSVEAQVGAKAWTPQGESKQIYFDGTEAKRLSVAGKPVAKETPPAPSDDELDMVPF